MVEETSSAKYKVDIGDHAMGVVIGDGSTLFQQFPEQPLIEESLDDVKADSFVPPSQGDVLIQTLQDQHLLVICGANRMGKAALARYIASHLQELRPAWHVYRMRRRTELQDLIDVLATKENLIALIYDVDPSAAEDVLQIIREMARNTANFVIMTSDHMSQDWHVPLECDACMVQVTKFFPYTGQDLKRLVIKQLGNQLSAMEKHGLSVHILVGGLGSPSQIVRFANALSEQEKFPDTDGLQKLFKAVQDVQFEVGRWLDRLGRGESYLALALALFDDLPEKHFWSLYEGMVEVWKKRDSRLVPLDYYAIEKFKVFVNLGPRIVFQDADYRDIVLDALLRQYRRSLVATLPFLQRAAERHSGTHRTTRIAVAQAVGQIGTVEWSEAENVLLSWATHTSTRVRASTSHAVREMADCMGLQALTDILEKLDRWVSANTPDSRQDDAPQMYHVRWTVASSLGRMGRTISRQRFREDILPRLYKLSRDDHFQVRKSVVYALRSLAFTRFADVRQILTERAADWHKDVRSEVATVLCLLRVTNWSDVRDLIREWLAGEKTERYRTVLELSKNHLPTADQVYASARTDLNLRTCLPDLIIEFLKDPERPEHEIVALCEVLVQRDRPSDSFLIIQPLVYALDHRLSPAKEMVRAWQDASRPELQAVARIVLNELAAMRTDRKRRWQVLLKHHLYDEGELQAFAETLPPAEQRAFWRDVLDKRAGIEKAKAFRYVRILAVLVGLVPLSCCLYQIFCLTSSILRSLFD